MKISNSIKSLLIILCAIFSSAMIKVGGQTDAGVKTVTLLSRHKYQDYARACFSFEHGVNGEASLEITKNDWDVQFGSGGDTFGVTMVVDDRSRIKDLGELNWYDEFKAPALAPHAEPKEREPDVAAVVGHMYVVHTKDTLTDLYALFRVESLEPDDDVTISWKLIPPPGSE